MSYWDPLNRYGAAGPQAADEFFLRPAKEFNRLLSQLVDELLLPLGWSRHRGLRWACAAEGWAERALEFQPLKSGVGARWGLRLAFVPTIDEWRKAAGDLHLSYDPLDYQRAVAPWALSRFATDEELGVDVPDLVRRAVAGADSLGECGCDLHALARCFEEKKTRKYVRLGFQNYPYEALAYAAVLGLLGREEAALREIEAAFARLEAPEVLQQKYRRALAELWAKGV